MGKLIFQKQLQPYRPSVSKIVDHIDYIVRLVGDDYVGIGSDFDGVSSLPVGMDDVTKYPLITRRIKTTRVFKQIDQENSWRQCYEGNESKF